MWLCLVVGVFAISIRQIDSGTTGFDYNTPEDELRQVYDFIIVGGGPAGLRLLEKLTNATASLIPYRVLLLEAGGNPPAYSDIPLFYSYGSLPENRNLKWVYPYNTNGLHSLAWSKPVTISGKVLGGGSTINQGAYQRGCAGDYDRIQIETKCPGWSYKEVLRTFNHDENMQDPILRANGNYGTKGSYCIDAPLLQNNETGGYKAWKEALELQGMQYGDYHDGTCHSKGYRHISNHCNGVRYSAVTSYVTPFYRARKDQMHIKLNTVVTKLIIENTHEHGPRVIGVETADAATKKPGKTFIAAREVIVTAGALKTAQLLMVSGIGPGKHLKSVGVKPIVDLPGVGEHLHNHPGIQSFYIKNVPSTWIPKKTCDTMDQYTRTLKGDLASSGADMVGVAYARMNDKQLNRTAQDPIVKYNLADVEHTFTGGAGLGKPSFGSDEDLIKQYQAQLGEDILAVNTYMMHTKTKSSVKLNTTSMFDPPILNLNLFSEDIELNSLALASVKLAEMLRSKPFADNGVRIYDVPFPKCKQFEFASFEYFKCLAQQTTHTNFHHAGTAKMGCDRNSDPMAVVDGRCRVYGIKGLRVADTSISQSLPQGHAMAFAYLAGSKCGDFILQDYRPRRRYY